MPNNLEFELSQEDVVVTPQVSVTLNKSNNKIKRKYKAVGLYERFPSDDSLRKITEQLNHFTETYSKDYKNLRFLENNETLFLIGDVDLIEDDEQTADKIEISNDIVWDISRLTNKQLVTFIINLDGCKTQKFQDLCDLKWYDQILRDKYIYYWDNNYWDICSKADPYGYSIDARGLFGEFELEFAIKERRTAIDEKVDELEKEITELKEYQRLKVKYGDI